MLQTEAVSEELSSIWGPRKLRIILHRQN